MSVSFGYCVFVHFGGLERLFLLLPFLYLPFCVVTLFLSVVFISLISFFFFWIPRSGYFPGGILVMFLLYLFGLVSAQRMYFNGFIFLIFFFLRKE